MLFLYALRCELLPQFSQFSLILSNNYSSYLELKLRTFLAWRHYRLPGKLGIYCFLSGSFCIALPKGRICSLHCLLLVCNSNFNRQYLHTCEISIIIITTFIAMPIDVVKLTLSLRPSDMKKGQSMVKYTFLFNISVINLTFLGYIIIL